MTHPFETFIISSDSSIKQALETLNNLAPDPMILFVTDENEKLIGSVTDGDIRRSLLTGAEMGTNVTAVFNKNPRYIKENDFETSLETFKSLHINLIPVVNDAKQIVDLIDLSEQRARLPLNAIIMAGGKGTRLLPLTADIPKPLVKVGDKAIIEYNLELLKRYGIRDVEISVNHLRQKIMDFLGNGSGYDLNITYLEEDTPMGTIGAVTKSKNRTNDYFVVMNSDLLTNINLEEMYRLAIRSNADMVIASTTYTTQVPYAVLEEDLHGSVTGLWEKPTYTYFSNAGIYLIRTKHIDLIPKDDFYDATDLIGAILKNGGIIKKHRIIDYWMDIGNHEDYRKAQEDVNRIKF